MKNAEVDKRNPDRRAQDERIAAEPPLRPLDLPAGAEMAPVEAHLASRQRRPIAVSGIVEIGLVRPLDPTIKLSENSRVIIVASEQT